MERRWDIDDRGHGIGHAGRLAPGASELASLPGHELVFEVATGMLDADTEFATHGHTLLLRVSGVS